MSDQAELMRRAEELATDLYEEVASEDERVDKVLMNKALGHVIAAQMLLKGTTAEFKASL